MAKNTIVTRITLEGAQQITGDLKNLGTAGERALKQIKNAADAANSGGVRLAQVFTGMRTAFTQLGTATTGFVKSVEKVGDSIDFVAKRVGILSAAVGLAATAFIAFTAHAGASAEEIQNQASAVGLSTQELQKFGFAANEVGLESEKFTQVMSIMVAQLEATAKATDSSETALGRFGISADQAASLLQNPADALKFISDQFAGMADGSEKTGAAIDIFGRRIGAKLIPFLNLGAQGLNQMGQEAVRLGAAVSDETLTKLAAFDDSLDVLKATAKGAQLSIASIFAPALTQGANALTELIAQNEALLQEFAQTLVNNIVPIVKDAINAITGHDDQVNAQWVLDVRDNLIQMGLAAQAAFNDIILPAFNFVTAAAERFAQILNGVFGTEFTGKELLIAAAILSLTGVFGVLASVIGVVVAAFGVLSSTAGLVVAAVVLVGLDIVLFSKLLASIDWAGIGQSIYDGIAGAFQAIGEAIGGFASAAIKVAKGIFDDFLTYIEGTWLGKILTAVASAITGIGKAQTQANQPSNQDTGGAGFARGGRAGRPGRKGARDTVLAWFDPREFVIRPEATEKLGSGVLNFINQAGELPGFAMGGLVAAAGGRAPGAILAPLSRNNASNGPRHTLNLSIEGEQFPGLMMGDETLAALGRFAAGKRMTSGGRKPSWYGG